MHDLAPLIGILGMFLIAGVVAIVYMVLTHLKETSRIAESPSLDQNLVGEVQELKRQVSDLKELLTDIAINTPTRPAIQERISEHEQRT